MSKKIIKSKDISKKLGLKEKVNKCTETSRAGLLPDEGSGVLNKKVLDSRTKAQSIIEDARLEAEHIRMESKGLLEQVGTELEKAKKKGFKEGHEEGLSGVTEKVMALEKLKEDFYKNAEENVIKLVMMVAEKVIGKIVNENSKAIESIVKQALEKTLGDKILVKLSPKDYKTVTDSKFEFHDVLDRTRRLTFKEDESVQQGGCVVETEVGTIDARLETQLDAIKKALEL